MKHILYLLAVLSLGCLAHAAGVDEKWDLTANATDSRVTTAGRWKVTYRDAEGTTARLTLALIEAGGKLSGEVVLENGDTAPVQDGQVAGTGITFKVVAPEGDYQVRGTVTGTEIKGNYTAPDGSKGSFSGQK